MRFVLLFLFAHACYKGPPPFAPVPPLPLEPFSRTIELPQPLIADESQLYAVPPVFPLRPPASVIVALPSYGAAEPDGSTHRDSLRAGLIAAFLGAGYRVKDAGEFNRPGMHIVSQPGDGKGSTELRYVAMGDARLEGELAILEPLGLSVSLEDPTSLWAPVLTEYPDLAATHFFRVFELEVSEQPRGVGGRLYYTAAQVDAFEARAHPLNVEAEAWLARRDAFAEATVRFQQDHARYRAECEAWLDRWPSQRRACQPTPLVPELPPIPQQFSRQTMQQYLEAASGTSTPRVVGRILAELVDTSNGEVVWVGRTEVEVDPGPNAHARVIALMLAKLRGA